MSDLVSSEMAIDKDSIVHSCIYSFNKHLLGETKDKQDSFKQSPEENVTGNDDGQKEEGFFQTEWVVMEGVL